MKKLFALILALLLTMLIFTSCDMDIGENESSVPVEPSSVELSSVEVSNIPEEQSSIIEITSEEEESLTPTKPPIPYTEEDRKYFEKYVFQLVFAPEFSDPNELDASGLFAFFARMYNAYEADDYGDKYYGEDGLYHVPLADVTDVLIRYLGEGYSEKVKQCSFYNSKTKYFDAPAFDPVGGGWGFELFPFPIQREGKCVVVPFYIFDEKSSKIVNAHEFTIEEYKDGFYVRKNIRLTEEEIADLNEKYFGEA